ncbi:heme-binding protein [Marinobacter changyiensis]|uniref:heme-binding protein n=1 Tax=Marinobacter changyiensis TaxID=2604091 RepID=UPI001C54FEBD|nr:heme-binding protein [Marinobacter changyiensis]
MKNILLAYCSLMAFASAPALAEVPSVFDAGTAARAADINENIRSLSEAIANAAPSMAATSSCRGLPDHSTLKTALEAAVLAETSGLDFEMWATIVNRDGVVCAVAFSGDDRGAQWPGSRVISAQKANTANAFSLDGLALSTANLFSAVQPNQSLFGLQESNPVDVRVAYKGPSSNYGQANDPMVGQKIGGVNVFGGGLALYEAGSVVGSVGVSGDTSCADHMIGWRVRYNLALDALGGPKGVNDGDPQRPDNIIYDINDDGVSANGFGHPTCLNTGDQSVLPPVN